MSRLPDVTHVSMVDHTVNVWFRTHHMAGMRLKIEPVLEGLVLMGLALTEDEQGAVCRRRDSSAEMRAAAAPWSEARQQMNTLIGVAPFRKTRCVTHAERAGDQGTGPAVWHVVLPPQSERSEYKVPCEDKHSVGVVSETARRIQKDPPSGESVKGMLASYLRRQAELNAVVDELGINDLVRVNKRGHVMLLGAGA